jgi:hypothetical protein
MNTDVLFCAMTEDLLWIKSVSEHVVAAVPPFTRKIGDELAVDEVEPVRENGIADKGGAGGGGGGGGGGGAP